MKLHAQTAGIGITSYGPGYFVLGEETVRHSILLAPDGVIESWAPATPDDLDEENLRLLIAHRPEVVLLGTGARQVFPRAELLRPFAEAQVGLEVMDTPAACRTCNVLIGEGRQVVAGLLLP